MGISELHCCSEASWCDFCNWKNRGRIRVLRAGKKEKNCTRHEYPPFRYMSSAVYFVEQPEWSSNTPGRSIRHLRKKEGKNSAVVDINSVEDMFGKGRHGRKQSDEGIRGICQFDREAKFTSSQRRVKAAKKLQKNRVEAVQIVVEFKKIGQVPGKAGKGNWRLSS